MTMRHDKPVLAIISSCGDDVSALAGQCGWSVSLRPDFASLGDTSRPDACLVDAREGMTVANLAVIPRDVPCIAMVGSDEPRLVDELVALGVTHFLPWPCGAAIFAATLNMSVAVRKRLNECESAGKGDGGATDDETGGDLDALTGLASRSAAREWLDARLGSAGSAEVESCLLIGISQFASVNAAYGKTSGDAVLERVAKRVRKSAHAVLGSDALIARMGGTEYLVAFEKRESAEDNLSAAELARLILADVSRPFVADEQVIRLTARCGLATPVGGDDASRLLRRASAALADARRSHTSDIVERSGARKRGRNGGGDIDQLDADLRLALEAGEIGIVYQPQYESTSDRIVGVEALARWNHPQLGQLDAGTLFEAADRSDYLLPLSRHIQRTALTEAGKWPEKLSALRLSINVTAADLAQEDFLPVLMEMIETSGFLSHRITVEITETGLIENIEHAGKLMQKLRHEDISVAIDDFGTGYSSLSYLKSLHPDYLKIDHSLSRDILGTPRDRIILRAIIAMARSLAMKVIAEGVESEEQLTLLARDGCDIYQGFLRSPAVTSKELVKLVERDG